MPPYNGSGTYTLTAGQPVVAGTDILDSTFNTLTADLATALSTCVTRDGQSPPTTNLPMGSFKLTGLAAGTANGHSVRFEQLQTGVNKLITVAGTGDVITGTMTPTYTAYATGDIFSFVVGLVNTTNVTINIDGLGAKAITVNGSTALVAGSLPANKAVLIEYDGTRFQLLTDNYVGAATGTLAVANGGTGVTTSTGSGANVLGTSPTLTTPTISTITSAAATALTLQSASTTAVTIDTSQNVGIGTASPANRLDCYDASAKAAVLAHGYSIVGANAHTANGAIQVGNNGAATLLLDMDAVTGGTATASIYNVYSGILRFGTNNTERMRIDSSGNLLVGTTSSIMTTARLTVQTAGSAGIISATSSNTNLFCINTAAASWEPIGFRYNTSTEVGKIVCTSSATSYATSSDYRLKDNVTPMTGALATVALLKPCNYKWIADGSDGQGFIAHEIQAVVPDCVTGEKDAVDAEGKPKYQGIDTSFLVATLTAAIQELNAKFEEYKAAHP